MVRSVKYVIEEYFTNVNLKMKALICYWGLVRGFKFQKTFDSHKQHIWDVLKEQNIDFDVMIHTYNKQFDFQVFNIHNTRYCVIEDDAIVSQRIIPKIRNVYTPTYFTEEHRLGLFKCWHSQQHLHDQILKIKHEYDFIITLDIAQYFATSIPKNIKDLDFENMYVSNFESFNGYNPRFCMSNVDNILFYLSKFNYVLADEENIPDNMIDPDYQHRYIEFMTSTFDCTQDELKNIPNLHPEWQLKTYLDVIGQKNICEIPIKFWRVRINGQIEGISNDDIQLYNVSATPVSEKPNL